MQVESSKREQARKRDLGVISTKMVTEVIEVKGMIQVECVE